MIYSDEFPLVSEHHDLIFCASGVWIFPFVDGYLSCLGAVFAGHMEYTTARSVLSLTEALFTDASVISNVGI